MCTVCVCAIANDTTKLSTMYVESRREIPALLLESYSPHKLIFFFLLLFNLETNNE